MKNPWLKTIVSLVTAAALCVGMACLTVSAQDTVFISIEDKNVDATAKNIEINVSATNLAANGGLFSGSINFVVPDGLVLIEIRNASGVGDDSWNDVSDARAVFTPSPTYNGSNLTTLVLDVAPGAAFGDVFNISINNADFASSNLTPMPLDLTDVGKITIDDADVHVGSVTTSSGENTVDVPVTIQGNPGINTAVLHFNIPAGLRLLGFNHVGGMRLGESNVTGASVVLSNESTDEYYGTHLVTLELEILDKSLIGVRQDISVNTQFSSISDSNARTLNVQYVTGGVTVVVIIMRGDANRDGAVNVADITYLKRVLVRIPGFPSNEECDVNNDGVINAADLTYLKGHITGRPGFPLNN
ncbi:MAG: dockerin type I repeat-containing protein [Oscillospiraceae bacterium]|nr:dockerin type I repeat-containing protein [Oscillospiraceae bacterium]